ncbi:MAG: xylulose 5-phosphate 3-epimerase [Alphaproteobacteria bacterium CG11_big_fil_rev_8_21_14_0_20_39_49]|nr:MAG: xylulose 5-phosphate 3-epimerase [Alphaproteobacteria bacterium CG11_big_fil_rev_8_21_14_0_20_39_49]
MIDEDMTTEERTWLSGYGVIKHEQITKLHIKELLKDINIDKQTFYKMLSSADKVANAAMWLSVHQVYAKNVYTDGRKLALSDFKKDPQGHLGGTLNMIPAYVGYMLANALSNFTRAWVMEQGHAVSAIDSVNLLLDNMTEAHKKHYCYDDKALSKFCRDFYSYKINDRGVQESPLGSHVNANTGGGHLEGGYLGFASLQYAHMPLLGERLVAFLSDGAFEEQKGSDWTSRWWRAEDSGLICPIMISNGRRIDQRSTMEQEGGAEWFAEYLKLHDFEPIIFDGRDPAAFAWCILEQEKRLLKNVANLDNINKYKIKIPYGVAVAPKGAGFYNEGTNFAHNLPLVKNPRYDVVAAERFNIHCSKLFVDSMELSEATSCLSNHRTTGRIKEKDNPIANRDVSLQKSTVLPWKKVEAGKKASPMDAIDTAFVLTLQDNKHLRPRVGNPDEMLSNKMDDTLEELKFRVVEAEGASHESTLGNVITALNEEAVAGAAFGNKGGINIIVTYEAFGSKMFGEARQEIIFSKHLKEHGKKAKWLSVPVVMTSNTWENSKNELSHQDPSMSESMLGETSDISRVIYPADYNSTLAVMDEVYKTQGQIWTVVAPKHDLELVFSKDEAKQLMHDGGISVKQAQFLPAKAEVALVVMGAYQLKEAIKASKRLTEKKIPHVTSYIIEPGKFRKPRNKGEEKHQAPKKIVDRLFPFSARKVIVMTHNRPELITGIMQPMLNGRSFSTMGFIGEGGTLDIEGMLFVNKCSWAHVVQEFAIHNDINPEMLLTPQEYRAVRNIMSPCGVIF